MSANSDYRKRFSTGWTEQVMIACDYLAKAVAEAHPHNPGDFNTLDYAINELAGCLYDQGFKPQDLKDALAHAVKYNSYLNAK